jgi:hypothetical protein
MLGILERLFIKLPLHLTLLIVSVTLIIPLIFWIINGDSWFDVVDDALDYLD